MASTRSGVRGSLTDVIIALDCVFRLSFLAFGSGRCVLRVTRPSFTEARAPRIGTVWRGVMKKDNVVDTRCDAHSIEITPVMSTGWPEYERTM